MPSLFSGHCLRVIHDFACYSWLVLLLLMFYGINVTIYLLILLMMGMWIVSSSWPSCRSKNTWTWISWSISTWFSVGYISRYEISHFHLQEIRSTSCQNGCQCLWELLLAYILINTIPTLLRALTVCWTSLLQKCLGKQIKTWGDVIFLQREFTLLLP